MYPPSPKKFPSFIVGATTARREQASRFKADNERRSSSVTLLNPDEVAGDIDGSRLMSLTTTLHGMAQQLTLEDLRQFQANIRNLKKRFTGGVSARAMLDRSLKIDRDRANAQIHTAVPMSASGGVIQFITNAGPDSKVTRHHVQVELLNYSAIAASPKPAVKLAKELLEGAARWNCSCERFRYYYRFVLTTLKSNYNVAETAFPKIRNPELRGTCCKHIARVAHNMLQGGTVRAYAQKMIERGRSDMTAKRVDESKDEIKRMAAQAAAESKRKQTIQDPKTPAEKRRATMMRKVKEAMKQGAQAQAAPEASKTEASKPVLTPAQIRRRNASAQYLLSVGSITQAQFNQYTEVV